MKRKILVGLGAAACVFSAWTSSASGQVDPTTTLPDVTTTTADVPTTTVAQSTTTVVAPSTTIPQIALPGEHVTGGTLDVGATFKAATASNCTATGNVAGGEINIMKDTDGKIGAVYGKATLGATTSGLVVVELGPLPLAVGAFRTIGTCNQDVVGIGGYTATPTSAQFQGVGYGAFPSDYADSVSVNLSVTGTEAGGSLNLQSAYDFLAAPRPANRAGAPPTGPPGRI